jgi:hypothetical protein
MLAAIASRVKLLSEKHVQKYPERRKHLEYDKKQLDMSNETKNWNT